MRCLAGRAVMSDAHGRDRKQIWLLRVEEAINRRCQRMKNRETSSTVRPFSGTGAYNKAMR